MKSHRIGLVVSGITLALSACNSAGGGGEADAGDSKAQQEAIAELKEPVALISAYRPYIKPADDKDKFAPKRHPDVEKATICAANEVRHAANIGRQKIGPAGMKSVEAALLAVATDCTDASEPEAAEKCNAAVQKLDEELKKTAAAGVKVPQIAPESITEEAKKRISSFLKAKGPSAADTAYVAKRADPAASADDVFAACQAAAEEADKAAKAYDKADEPIRLIAVTRKMSMDSQCGILTATSNVHKDVLECKKPGKAKTTECKIACSKAKNRIEEGLPAAAFAPIEKDVADICKE